MSASPESTPRTSQLRKVNLQHLDGGEDTEPELTGVREATQAIRGILNSFTPDEQRRIEREVFGANDDPTQITPIHDETHLSGNNPTAAMATRWPTHEAPTISSSNNDPYHPLGSSRITQPAKGYYPPYTDSKITIRHYDPVTGEASIETS